MSDEFLDPTDSVAVPRRTAPRPSSLEGRVITLLDISKAKGDHLLDRVEELLRERHHPKAIIRHKKPTFARPAPEDLRARHPRGDGAGRGGSRRLRVLHNVQCARRRVLRRQRDSHRHRHLDGVPESGARPGGRARSERTTRR